MTSFSESVQWLRGAEREAQLRMEIGAAAEALERLLRFTHALTAADHQLPLNAGADLADLHFAESTMAAMKGKGACPGCGHTADHTIDCPTCSECGEAGTAPYQHEDDYEHA